MIRQNRDTLYSSAIVDISEGATLTLPDAGERYLSVMVVNNDHYINDVFHDAGDHELTVDRFDTDYVLVAARILVDPNDPADLAAVHQLQDQMALTARSARPFVMPDYDAASFDATRDAVLTLARGLTAFDHAFGSKDAVDSLKHLLGTAAGWGGLPEHEAFYLNVDPGFPPGEYQLTVARRPRRRVLVDLGLQRRRLLRGQRPQRLQRQQHHAAPNADGIDHRALRRMRRRPSQLPADHRRLELRRPPLPATARDPRRHLDLPRRPARLTRHPAGPLQSDAVMAMNSGSSSSTSLPNTVCEVDGLHDGEWCERSIG